MFDIKGYIDLKQELSSHIHSLDNAFSCSPWVDCQENHRRFINTRNMNVLCLSRETDAEDYACFEGTHLFVIGEVWARWAKSDFKPGRLTADTLLSSYLHQGMRVTSHIKGNYILVIYDETENTASLITSRSAVSPFYYSYENGKLYFATSAAEIVRSLPGSQSIDAAAVVETILFNFPMGERTFFCNIHRASPGSVISFSSEGISRSRYWDPRDLYGHNLLDCDEAVELGSMLLHKSVNLTASDQTKICASFTSGFDSRALRSVLEKDRNDVLLYSFGIPGSINVEIPKRICEKLGYHFLPIYLDKEYEDAFSEFAWQTITLSDGLVVQRANYPYAFKKISAFSRFVLTGLFGSEFLRTFQNLGTVVSKEFDRINRSTEPVFELRQLLSELRTNSYLNPEIIDSSAAGVETDVEEWFSWSRDFSPDQRLYLYLISEVDRKYFGAEISTERVYATTRFPFFDDEFVEFLFTAPFAGPHSKTIKPTVKNRFDSQKFYAHIIQKYKPELLSYTTDHGYPPGDLLKHFAILHVGPKHLFSRYRRRITKYREFKPEEWLSQFYTENLFRSGRSFDFISPRFREAFENKSWLTNLVEFDKIAALKLWLAKLLEKV